ncbi:hypothetical protein QTP86_014527 [Hemibagrus guttatus]|nr:hypothetical protein QTP86_014527 [Hemibagrus guttatus]
MAVVVNPGLDRSVLSPSPSEYELFYQDQTLDTFVRNLRTESVCPTPRSTTALTCVLRCFPCEPSWAGSPFVQRAPSPPMLTMTRSKTFQAYLPTCHRTYSCIHCRAHLANHDELISKSFQGSQGRAYLFNSVVNVGCGPAEERVLLTGLHAVADIYCENCKTTLGWKYVGCELEEKERFWSELDEVMESIPTGERVVIGADFNGGNTGDEEVMGKFGVKERNLEGQMVVDFAKRMDMAVVNTYFQKREEHRVTYKSGDLEKAYDRVLREELWYCMRKSGVAEKYVRVVQDMYERSRTVVRCAVGQTEEFKVEVGLHQGSALSPFLFAIVMDQLSEEVRQESPWTMMFADDIVICSESREQVEENLERWRFALERRGMKVSRSKTEYMCVNEREGSGTVRLQGEEVKKVQEFKYSGSTVQSNGECGKEEHAFESSQKYKEGKFIIELAHMIKDNGWD